jgi:hypothetical protein
MKTPVFQLLALCVASIASAADTQPPAIQTITPSPATTLSSLTQISVGFSEAVLGVDAEDLLINGEPALSLSVSGNIYTFTCSTPGPGFVSVYFDVDHGITDQAGNPFDESAPGATWSYTLADSAAPLMAHVGPSNGSFVRALAAAEVTFNEAVVGVTTEDLLINGIAATNVTGAGAGPYRFSFTQPASGPVTFSWSGGHGIQDGSGNAFAGGNWTVLLDPTAPATIRINEFLAANESTTGLHDEDGELEDWIELFNYGGQTVNLAGWSLTDAPDRPRQWLFPDISLNPGQYLIVFASGKDRASAAAGSRLHANFQLSSAGEYLGLFSSDEPASSAASEFNYPEQRIDYSYGYDGAGQLRYFATPTPATGNGNSTIQDVVAPVHFSVSRGFFNAPFNLVLTTPTPGATIRYTLDGSPPTASSDLIYTAPILISNTTPVRAAAFKSNSLPSLVGTHTFLFGDQVLRQPANPPGFPSTWVTQSGSVIVPADYAMDVRIITNAAYTNLARQALTTLPSLSVVMKTSDLFSQANGIYANPGGFGFAWERPASAEFIFNDGSGPVQIDAGYRIQGGSSRDPTKTHKHSQRLLFRGAYGAGRFNYRFFNDSPVESFDTLVIDAGLNLVWTHRTDATQRRQAQYVRDQYVSDLQNAMGWPAFHGRFFNLYLNGLYWGVHGIHERPEEDFTSSYFGGDPTQWDILKNTTAFEVLSGDLNAWNAMRALANAGLTNDVQYQQIQQYLDVESLIDYMILNLYVGNTDWPHHNWYVGRRRQPGGTFKFFNWDAEHVLKDVTYDNSTVNNANTPAELYDQLRRNNYEFRLRFADHVHRHFFNDGLCTTNQALARYMARIREIDPAIVLESARWGDNAANADRPGQPYERNVEWLNELNRLISGWFPQRSSIVFNQFRVLNLYPSAVAPAFNQHGGRIARGFNLTMSAPAGAIYFTTNGVDPRVYLAGTVAADAQRFTNAVSLSRTAVVKARALVGTNWSALNEATFTVEQLIVPLRITEIMYNPPGGDAYEFIEVRNLGDTPLDVSGFSFSGITYVFPAGSVLSPGQTIVLAADVDPNAFAARYPGLAVFGYFSDRLANGGERLAIKGTAGETITSVDYNDGGQWPKGADGFGSSLEVVDPFGNPDQPANWRASAGLYGSPGVLPPAPAPSVVINEVMADNTGSVINAGTFPDWIELRNATATNVDLTGWSLSNDSNPRKFVFASGTALAPGAYVVVWCDFGTDTNSGIHAPISLERDGDSVSLYDGFTNRVDAISYGNQLANYTIGRVAEQWQLCSPTPNAPNAAAAIASSTNIVINEWLANASPGGADWIELFNASSTAPVSLQNIYMGSSNGLFQLQSLAFIPPLGYLQLFADEQPGPNHLDFKLPAGGGPITLYDASAALLSRVDYGPQTEGVSQGRLPDGSSVIQSFPGSASPGAANYLITYSGPFLNEVMARNAGAVRMFYGTIADWVELYNPSATNIDISGMRLSVDVADPNQWRFPPGATVPAQGYLVVWCTSLRPTSTALESELNTGHGIDAQSGSVFLFNVQGQVVDKIEFGFQIDDQTIGRSAGQWQLLQTPTPGTANSPEAQLGSPALLRINEWMAAPVVGDDWFELYNGGDFPVNLSGLFLTDDPSTTGVTKQKVSPLSFIGPHQWVRYFADGDLSRGRDHVNFALDSLGETIRLYNTNLQVIDSVDFGLCQFDVSEGRLPDGSQRIVRFPGSSTPAAANYLPLRNVVINEVLVDASSTTEQAVELYNPTSQAVDISDWWLSDSATTPRKFRIPPGTMVPPGGFRVFYAAQFGSTNNSLPLIFRSGPGEVWLFEGDSAGNLSGWAATAAYGVTFSGQSYGRSACGESVFSRLVRPTFGVDSPSTVEQFRLGTGAVNAAAIPTGDEEPSDPAFITQQPLGRIVPAGSSLILSVGACGTPPFNYQWFFNGAPVSNGTNAVLQLSNLQSQNTGSYFAIASNAFGAATSSVALISLGALPTITTQPQDWTTNSGNQATFSVAAQGNGLGYQWRFNAIPIDGATSSILTLSVVTLANVGDYSVLVSNAAGVVTSDTAHLTVVPSLQITAQPQGRSVLPGSNVIFSVTASGTGVLRYQWYFNSNFISAATADTLNINNAQLANHGFYMVEITDDYGSVRSQPALLTVRVAPSILQQPHSVVALAGSDVTFSVVATGTPPLGYRWRRNSQNFGPLRIDDPTLTITNVQPTNAGTYAVIVTNLVNTTGIISSNVTLSVLTQPSLLQPRLTNSQFEVLLHASTGWTHIVESSTNLSNWTELRTLVPTNSDTRIIDPSPVPNRFYRARLVP